MASAPQTYANHRHRPVLWLVSAYSGVVGFSLVFLFLLRAPGVISAGLIFLALSVMCLILLIRQYVIRLQDRIIRLEMRLRLARLGRELDADRVTIKQLVALRFASDGEMPGLLDKTVAENWDPERIKAAITNWQSDSLRT